MLRWRAATALVLAPVALGAIAWGSGPSWSSCSSSWPSPPTSSRAPSSRCRSSPRSGPGPFPSSSPIPYGPTGILVGALLGLPWALLWLAGKPETRTLQAVLAVLLMALWVGAPLAHLGLFPRSRYGVILVLIAVVGPWISDSGAYFAGRFFGRHLLFPSLSPNKTVEGGIGGLVCTMLVVGPVSYQFLDFTLAKAAVIGAGVSIFSQLGDLFESMLKRILDVKDLGHFLPGHGGILDRVDSLLFTAPAVYYISLLV